jgi:hypothetical protein
MFAGIGFSNPHCTRYIRKTLLLSQTGCFTLIEKNRESVVPSCGVCVAALA